MALFSDFTFHEMLYLEANTSYVTNSFEYFLYLYVFYYVFVERIE